jgi:spermidine synthase
LSEGLRFAVVLVCFFLSGFAGLLYETTWTRQFSFVFGTSGVAVSTVLAAYMGGLAAGARIVDRYLDRIERPVLVYGVLELGIALSALAVPAAIAASLALQARLLSGVIDPSASGAMVFYVGVSLVVLAVPTTLMGATLPLLARHGVRSDAQVGRRIGVLYAINTAGAVVGTLSTAFLLIPELGLQRTVWLGAAVNGLVFVAAVFVSRGSTTRRSAAAEGTLEARDESATDFLRPGLRVGRLIPVVALGAGTASFIYEVLWVRLLEHLVGSSVFAFAAMLASFLVGIALGGAIGSRFATTRSRAMRGIVWTQLGAALGSLFAYLVLNELPRGVILLGDSGEMASVFRLAGLAALTLLPSTLCVGALFPLAVRVAAANAEEAGRASARVYSWNTVGSIVGSLAAGFWLLPAFAYGGTLRIAAMLNLSIAGLAWYVDASRSARRGVFVAIVGIATIVLPSATPWRLLRTSPLTRSASTPNDAADVLFTSVGRSASVMVLDTPYGIRVQTNGVPESLILTPGGLMGLTRPARWMGILPSLSKDRIERMMVIGLGGGVILEEIPDHVERVEVIELEPQVVEANRAVATLRARDPLDDPRMRLRIADARRVLSLTTDEFDAIVSQPSHPWTAGASHLYTREFFESVRSRLASDGYFVQWLGLGFVDEPLLQSFVATLAAVFPNVQAYLPNETSLLFVSSVDARDPIEGLDAYLAAPGNLGLQVGMRSAAELRAALVLDDAAARRFSEGAPLITDDDNVMAIRAPLVRYSLVGRISRVLGRFDPLRVAREDVPQWALLRPLLRLERYSQARRVAESIADLPLRRAAETWLESEKTAGFGAGVRLREIAPDSPLYPEASWALARRNQDELARATPGSAELFDRLDPATQLVVQGWRLGLLEDWEGLSRLDTVLAEIDPNAPAWEAAQQLRFVWRVQDDEEALVREALEILDGDPSWTVQRLALRAASAARLGDGDAVLHSMRALEGRNPRRLTRELARGALEALETLPPEAVGPEERERLQRFLEIALGQGPQEID